MVTPQLPISVGKERYVLYSQQKSVQPALYEVVAVRVKADGPSALAILIPCYKQLEKGRKPRSSRRITICIAAASKVVSLHWLVVMGCVHHVISETENAISKPCFVERLPISSGLRIG
jgi:hypothetical protein